MKQKTPTLPASIDRREFGTSRKGYDKREVKEFLRELESNFRELERWAQDTKTRLQKAEFEAEKSRSSEGQSVDSAMVAVFDAKDRVLSRARKQAAKIEAEARDRAASRLESMPRKPAFRSIKTVSSRTPSSEPVRSSVLPRAKRSVSGMIKTPRRNGSSPSSKTTDNG